jgi:DNA-binding MarR family transcriptional regulator
VPENPQWLTVPERAAWLAMGAMMIKLPAALDQQMQRDADLTFFEYMVLAMLSESPERTQRMSDLAALTSASPSRLSHVASRLESAGLLARQRCPGRGRSTNAVLTDAGYARVVAAAPAHVTAVRTYFIDALTPTQLSTLTDIAAQVRERIDPGGRWEPVNA